MTLKTVSGLATGSGAASRRPGAASCIHYGVMLYHDHRMVYGLVERFQWILLPISRDDMYLHTHVSASIHVSLHACTQGCTHVWMDGWMHAWMHVHKLLHIHVRIHVCMYICMHVCMHACMYAYVHVRMSQHAGPQYKSGCWPKFPLKRNDRIVPTFVHVFPLAAPYFTTELVDGYACLCACTCR